MSKIKDIINGWGNYIVPNKEADELAKKRLKICIICKDDKGQDNLINGTYEVFLNDNIEEAYNKKCKQCGCPASTFSRSKKYKCPLKKW